MYMTATGHDNLYFELDIRTKTNADDIYENVGGEGEASARTQNSSGNPAQEASNRIPVRNALQEEKRQVRRMLFFIAAAVFVTFLIAVGALGLAVFMMMFRNVGTASKPASLIQDVDECAAHAHLCHANAVCNSTKGSHMCSCKLGFSGDGKTCSDIDECSVNTHNCSLNSVCSNTEGSYKCSCKLGYYGDGRTCIDIDECSTGVHWCSVNAECNNIKGSHICICKLGFSGNGNSCADIDECATNTHNCSANAVCNNTVGSYNCSCKLGYAGDDNICNDIDECSTNTHNCSLNSVCNNNEGSYKCNCKRGYSGDGRTCIDINECSAIPAPCDVNANCQNNGGSYLCFCKLGYAGDGKTCSKYNSCDRVKRTESQATDGNFTIFTSSSTLQVYCDMTSSGQGWTLIARFSNDDAKNWMDDTGYWWYDRNVAFGSTTHPSSNTDMLSPAFWLVSGNEFKITRSDDPQHTALLQTTGDCLGGQTLRSKITSYGDFRNGTVWASNLCQGNCTIQYGGQYQTTEGFAQALCNGEIQSANGIGFWCDWGSGDGSVMMIGGGGSNCARADHGIGITEADAASFNDATAGEGDFGQFSATGSAGVLTKSYSLNLWIR